MLWLLLSRVGSKSCGSSLPAPHRALFLGLGTVIWEEDQRDFVLVSCLTHCHFISLSRSVQTLVVCIAVKRKKH